MFVLLVYLRGLQGRHVTAGLAGACAVVFRQTNIVWVAFVGATSACSVLLGTIMPTRRTFLDMNDLALVDTVYKWFCHAIKHDRRSLIRSATTILKIVWPYLIVVISFLIFVWFNGNIVVGAKKDHEAGFHVPQLFYFFAFTAGFSFVHFVSIEAVRDFVDFTKRKFVLVCTLFLLTVISIWRFTYVHRYLVADNRHYTFYVWSRIIVRHASMRYLLVPVYLFSAFAVLRVVSLKQHLLWRIVFICCVTAVLVPSTLLEFRYFIVPYLLLRINIPCPPLHRLLGELGLYTVINLISLYLFLYRPFHWSSEPGLQRFMW